MKGDKQFLVIGLGRFGSSVATALARSGHEVLAIDTNEEVAQKLNGIVTHVVVADTTDEDTLKALGVRNFDVAVVAIGSNIQANIFTTLLLKNLGVPFIVAKALNDLHGKMLEKIGADRVVYPEYDMGQRVAHNIVTSNVLEYIELSPNVGIVEIGVPRSLIGKTLIEADLRARFEVNVVAIKRDDQVIVPPQPDAQIEKGDLLVVVGGNIGIAALEGLQ
ncbi:MAG: TrkA family potassium uptake protein [Negativicutes bacterium]|nr:TrkA family potassium uptake protein [Negativicutes bacterium]